MTQNKELIQNKVHFVLSSVALVFCLIWVLVGESDIKIIAIAISFIYFLKSGIDTEMSARALDTH